jgi:hypothetical protein
MQALNDFIANQPAWHWWALGALLLAAEIASTTQYLLWPGIAALLVGILKFADPGLDGRLAVFLFAIFSVAATVAWKRSPWGKHDHVQHPTLNRRTHTYVGRVVKAADNFSAGHGAVLVDDSRWNAVVIDSSAPIKGDMLEVVSAEGTILKCRLAPGSILFGQPAA